MSKPHTYPTLFDEALQISITKLKEWEYLNPEQFKSGALTWSTNGNQIGSISILINTQSEQPYIKLDYKYREEPRQYKVRLVSIPSNLGKGIIWYFLCPQTNKRCRKLYSISGYFLHREAFNGCMYECQTRSKKWRQMDNIYGYYFDLDRYYKELYSKHFKTHYNGLPTKRYLKLIQKIKRAGGISDNEMANLFF